MLSAWEAMNSKTQSKLENFQYGYTTWCLCKKFHFKTSYNEEIMKNNHKIDLVIHMTITKNVRLYLLASCLWLSSSSSENNITALSEIHQDEGKEVLKESNTLHLLEDISSAVVENKETKLFDGLHRLPASEFSIYFTLPLDTLLIKPIEILQTWLQTIRLGWDLHGWIYRIVDCYSSNNGPSRSWLGLPPIPTH